MAWHILKFRLIILTNDFNKGKPVLTTQQLVENAKQHITELSVTETADRLNQTENCQIIDVREWQRICPRSSAQCSQYSPWFA